MLLLLAACSSAASPGGRADRDPPVDEAPVRLDAGTLTLDAALARDAALAPEASVSASDGSASLDAASPGPDAMDPPPSELIFIEEIPFNSTYTQPDHTSWGINMRRIARQGDRVFTYYVDNRDYCLKNPGPGVLDCDATGSNGWSSFTVLEKRGLDGAWAPIPGMSFRTVRPGNLLLDPVAGCVHLLVFAPHSDLTWRQVDHLGSLRHIWFSSTEASPAPHSETIVPEPRSVTDPETVNIRVGAGIAPDGRVVVAWGTVGGQSLSFRAGDGAGCDKSWTGGWVETGLAHDHLYPMVAVGGLLSPSASRENPAQLHYTGLAAQMDQYVTDCDGDPAAYTYRKLRYWEDSRDGSFFFDSISDLWSSCSPSYDRVQHTDLYIDTLSRTHLVFAEMSSCASSAGGCHTAVLEHWIKLGDSFHHGAGAGVWPRKVDLYWGSDVGPCGAQENKAINEVRLFEADADGDGFEELFYAAVSWDGLYLAKADETRDFLCAADLVAIEPAGGWPASDWGGLRVNVATRGGGTSLAEPFVDLVLYSTPPSNLTNTSRTFYIRVPEASLPAILANRARP